MEARIARIESDVAHMRTDIADIKVDLRAMRDDLRGGLRSSTERLDDKIDSVKDSLASAKIWALLLYIAFAGGMLGVMARGFGWI
jgi:hypothetical protein